MAAEDIDIFEEGAADQGMYRSDGAQKSARGFIGPVKNLVTGGTMTEFSTDMQVGGRKIQIPTMVPTLSREEIGYMQRMEPGAGWDMSNPMVLTIIDKARAHARKRMSDGMSPFYQDKEGRLQNLQRFNTGGSISGDIRKLQGRPEPEPFLSPARAAYLAAQFPFGAGTLDATGGMRQLPDIDAIDPFSGAPGVSMAENLAQRNYLDFGLQGASVLGDAAYAVPVIGPAIAGALKVPRALQKLLQAGENLGQASERSIDELREATEAFDLKKSQLEAEGVDPELDPDPQLISLKDDLDVKKGNYIALNFYASKNPEATGFVVPSYEEGVVSLAAKQNLIRTDPEAFDQRLLFLHQTDKSKMTALLEGDNKMPSPSIAVLDKDQSFEGYGDIDLIGNPNSFNPENPENPMYKSDAWTPTTGAVYRLAAPDALDNFKFDFGGYRDIDPEMYDIMEYKIGASSVQTPSDIDSFGTSFNADPFHAKNAKELFMASGDLPKNFDNFLLTKFFKDKYGTDYVNDVEKQNSFDGQLVKTGMSVVDRMDQKSKERILKEFNNFKEELFQKYFPNLYTDSYDGPVPFDADEIAAEMGGRSQILGEISPEGDMDDIANISQLLAASTEATPIQSLGEAKAVAEGRLLRSGESMPAAFTESSELQREFYNSYGEIQDIIEDASFNVGEGYLKVPAGFLEELISETVRSGGSLDTIEEIVTSVGPMAYSVDDVATDLPDDVLKNLTFELKKLYDKVHGVDVKYFETKPTRAVNLDEFAGAIVPQREIGIIQKLKDKGLKVVTYTGGAEKQAARKQFKDQMFSIGGAGVLGAGIYKATEDSGSKDERMKAGGGPVNAQMYQRGGGIDSLQMYQRGGGVRNRLQSFGQRFRRQPQGGRQVYGHPMNTRQMRNERARGEGAKFFGNVLTNQLGLGQTPILGGASRNLATKGFGALGKLFRNVPGSRVAGNVVNRFGRLANKFMGAQQAMNPFNRNPAGGGILGLRGKGGPLGFGVLGGRRRERQSQQAYQDLTNYDVNAGYPNPAQNSNMTVEEFMAAQDPFAGQGPISPGGGLDSYGFGQSLEGIRHRDMSGVLNEIDQSVRRDQPFEQINDPSGQYYQLVDKATGNVFLQGQHHPDARPTGRRMQRMGGGM